MVDAVPSNKVYILYKTESIPEKMLTIDVVCLRDNFTAAQTQELRVLYDLVTGQNVCAKCDDKIRSNDREHSEQVTENPAAADLDANKPPTQPASPWLLPATPLAVSWALIGPWARPNADPLTLAGRPPLVTNNKPAAPTTSSRLSCSRRHSTTRTRL